MKRRDFKILQISNKQTWSWEVVSSEMLDCYIIIYVSKQTVSHFLELDYIDVHAWQDISMISNNSQISHIHYCIHTTLTLKNNHYRKPCARTLLFTMGHCGLRTLVLEFFLDPETPSKVHEILTTASKESN